MCDCSKQCTWFQGMLEEIGMPHPTVPLYADNQGAIFMAQNPVTNQRSKHIKFRYHYIREKIHEKMIKLAFVEGAENIADIFTKNLGLEKFSKFRTGLGIKIL